MAMDDEPTVDQWSELSLVVRNVELLVADPPSESRVPSGLFAIFPKQPELPPNANRLFTELHQPNFLGGRLATDAKRIVELLPGADLLGAGRAERLSRLATRLADLPAYRWLTEQDGYKKALKLLEKKSRMTQAPSTRSQATSSIARVLLAAHVHQVGYGMDTREFLLLAAFVSPIQTYQLYRRVRLLPPFPTKEEIESAAKSAAELVIFLHDCYAVREVVNIPLRFKQDLEQVAKALADAAPHYVKPRVDPTFNERRYADEVIENCGQAFGDCSPTLIRSLLDVIRFDYDDASLKLKIASWRRKQRTMVPEGGLAGQK